MISIPQIDINDDLVSKISSITTEKQLERAWAEYTESIATNYQTFVAYTSQVIDYIDTTDEQDLILSNPIITDEVKSIRNSIIESIMNGVELPFRQRSYYFLNYGEFEHYDYIQLLVTKWINDTIRIDLDPLLVEKTRLNSDFDVNGVNSSEYTLDVILDEINATWHAVTVDKSLAKGYSMADNVSDRLQVMRDEIATVFSSSYSDISGYLNERVNALKQGMSLSTIIEESIPKLGLNIEDEGKDYYTNCTFQEYTGATPTSAYCWDSVGNAIESGVKVAVKAVKSVFRSILKIGKKLFSKVATVAKQIFVDPYDLEEINGENGNHTIDTFSSYSICRVSGSTTLPLFQELEKGPLHFDFLTTEYVVDIPTINGMKYTSVIDSDTYPILQCLQFALNEKTDFEYAEQEDDKHYKMPTDIISLLELLFPLYHEIAYDVTLPIITNIQNAVDLNTLREYTNLITQGSIKNILVMVIRKIKPINTQITASILSNVQISGDRIYTNNPSGVYEYMKNQSNIYCGVSDTEIDLYNGFINSIILEHVLLGMLSSDGAPRYIKTKYTDNEYSQLVEYERDLYSVISYAINRNFTYANLSSINNTSGNSLGLWYKSSSVTNADFVNVATEISNIKTFNITNTVDAIFNDKSLAYLQIYNEKLTDIYSFGGDNLGAFIGLINAHFNDKQYNPLDYKFIPYNQQNADFEMSSFRIKTNQENIDAFNTFITTAVIVVAAVALTIVGIKILRNVSTKRSLKAAAMRTQLQNKIINGERPSRKDLKKLYKAERKAKKMNRLMGNSTNATTAANDSNSDGSIDLNRIIGLIGGTSDE